MLKKLRRLVFQAAVVCKILSLSVSATFLSFPVVVLPSLYDPFFVCNFISFQDTSEWSEKLFHFFV